MFDIFSSYISLSALLMQTDIFASAESLIIAVATLLSTASGLIVYALNKKSAISKTELSERDKQIMEIAKMTIMGSQKAVENIGQIRESTVAMYETLGLTDEQKQKLQEKVKPLLDTANETVDVGNRQVEIFKNLLIQLLGPEVDVDNMESLPREKKELSKMLRTTVTQLPK